MGSEKRKFVRAMVHCEIFIRSSSEHSIITYTENIGEEGIRVKIKKRLVNFSIVDLELQIENEKIVTIGKILYTVNLKENPLYYATGIEFHDMKEKDRYLIKNFVNKATQEEFKKIRAGERD